MIAIDTNILLRYLLADNKNQYTKAKKLISNHSPVLLTDVVLAETVWTLTGKRYQLNKPTICMVIRSLIEDTTFKFENAQVIWSALNNYEDSKVIQGKQLDFADALIFYKAMYTTMVSGKKLDGFFSFDKAFTQIENARVL